MTITATRPNNRAAKATSGHVGKGPIAMFLIAAALHLLVVWLVHDGTDGQALYPDAMAYDARSDVIAQVLRSGHLLAPREFAQYTGSEFWGYPSLMAAAKVLTSGGWLAAKLALALLGASAAPAAYLLVEASKSTAHRARAAGWLVAASPSLVAFDAWGLKDGLVVAILLWALVAIVKAPFGLACLVTIGTAQTMLYVRPIGAVFVVAALLTRAQFRARYVVGGAFLAVGALYYLLPRFTLLIGLAKGQTIDATTQFGFAGGAEATSLYAHPQYIATFLFGPFPWAYGPGSGGAQRWLYLGTVVWIATLALAWRSIRIAWQDREGVGRALVAGAATYAMLYLGSFGGAFYRQRAVLECALLILVISYSPLSPGKALYRVSIWFGVVSCIALLQSPDLMPTPAAKAAFAVVLAVLIPAALVPPHYLRFLRLRAARSLRSRLLADVAE
jgi:hypothetical protein